MRTDNRKIGKNNNRAKTDSIAKTVFSNKEVLAEFVRDIIPEFKGFERQEIVDALEKAKHYPRGLNTENVMPDGNMVRYDQLFRIPIPGSDGAVNVFVNIETQGDPYPGYDLDARAEFYVSSIFSGQKGMVYSKSLYDLLENAYSVWIMTNPPKSKRGTIRIGSRTWKIRDRNGVHEAEGRSRTNIIYLYLGDDSQKEISAAMELMGIILGNRSIREKIENVRARFNISLTDEYLSKMDGYVSFSEQRYNVGVREGK